MEVRVSGRHVKVTDHVRQYVEEKVTRLTKHFDGIHKVELTASQEGEQLKAEMVVHAVRGINLAAEGLGSSLTQAIDQVADRMDRQVRKLKERLKDHRGGPKGQEDDSRDVDESSV